MDSTREHDGHAPSSPAARPLWQLPAARAVPALLVGIAVTFVQSHAAIVGLVALAVLATATGAVLLLLRGAALTRADRWPVLAGWISIVAGVAAGLLAIVTPTVGALALVAGTWALAIGVVEGSAAWTVRDSRVAAERRIGLDWRTVAIASILAGVALLVLPRNEVVAVGLVGAYAILIGVFHGIAAASARMTSRSAA